MTKNFDCLSDVVSEKDSWRVVVRVVRLWEVPIFLNPKQTSPIEMVMVDEKVHIVVYFVVSCIFF